MIRIIKAEEVYTSNHDWLSSRFLFSFADYYDPSNMSLGRMRVFNDDVIAPHSGFPPHSHRGMEIVTIMNSGALTHTDSMGNSRSISDNYVQRMTAGTGVTHSEMNNSDMSLSLYQLWFTPRINLSTPSYEEKVFTPSTGLTLLVSGASPSPWEGAKGGRGQYPLSIGAEVKIYKGIYKPGDILTLPIHLNDHVLIYMASGEMVINNTHTLHPLDQARISGEEIINFSFISDCEMVVVVA